MQKKLYNFVDLTLDKIHGDTPLVPSKVFFTRGVGKHKENLYSFELALRDAGIEKFNLVRVSSIYPPGAKIVQKATGLRELKPGQIVFCVMAEMRSNEPNRLMAASVGLALPSDKKMYGYLSEHHCFGMTEKTAGDYTEDLAATMLASTLGANIDKDISWNEKKEEWKIQGHLVKTTNYTQSAIVDKNGLWTTVVSAAVFVP